MSVLLWVVYVQYAIGVLGLGLMRVGRRARVGFWDTTTNVGGHSRIRFGFASFLLLLPCTFKQTKQHVSCSPTSLGLMEAVNAMLPVHFRHGMQWQTVS